MAGLILSAFDVIGPAMIGPSSSHTAGAARIGLITRHLLGEAPRKVVCEVHGSFADTGRGHATDRALLAGLLGDAPDDPALPSAPTRAKDAPLAYEFLAVDLGDGVHPNTVRIAATSAETRIVVTASSVGGGVIEVVAIDGYATSFRGNLDTLVCWHADECGFLARITSLLACAEVNIATIRTTRTSRGQGALTVVELDGPPPTEALLILRRMSGINTLRHVSPIP